VSLMCLLNIIAGQFAARPQNVAVLDGSEVILNCTTDTAPSNTIAWRFIPAGSYFMYGIINDCASPPAGYSVTSFGTSCDLIILAVNSSQAGTYICDPRISGPPIDAVAEVIVIERKPSCHFNAVEFNYNHDDQSLQADLNAPLNITSTMTCTTNRYFHPSVTCRSTPALDDEDTSGTTSNDTHASGTYAARLSSPSASLSCTSRFIVVNPPTGDRTNNTPSYEYTCTTNVHVAEDCFVDMYGTSVVKGLFSSPNEHNPPLKYYFGYLPGRTDSEGMAECRERCRAASQCIAYTFLSNFHPVSVWKGECMGTNDERRIREPDQHAFSGIPCNAVEHSSSTDRTTTPPVNTATSPAWTIFSTTQPGCECCNMVCLNGGTLHVTWDSLSCSCLEPYQGQRCEKKYEG